MFPTYLQLSIRSHPVPASEEMRFIILIVRVILRRRHQTGGSRRTRLRARTALLSRSLLPTFSCIVFVFDLVLIFKLQLFFFSFCFHLASILLRFFHLSGILRKPSKTVAPCARFLTKFLGKFLHRLIHTSTCNLRTKM